VESEEKRKEDNRVRKKFEDCKKCGQWFNIEKIESIGEEGEREMRLFWDLFEAVQTGFQKDRIVL
jgi:hypothetical protein